MSFVALGIEHFVNPLNGKPVANGFVYVGEPDTDPTVVVNQKTIQLRKEDGTLVATSQPVQLGAAGVPLYNNSPVQIIVDGDYSLTIQDSFASQLYYVDSSIKLVDFATLEQFIGELKTTATLAYDNYAGLRATTGVDNRSVSVTSRTTLGDGGGGVFFWNSSNLSTEVSADPQEGIYVAPTSGPTGASGAWVRLFDGPVSVKWFGALGNDAADDTAAIQAALSFVASSITGVRSIWFPYGTYLITSQLDITSSSTEIYGDSSKASTIKIKDNSAAFTKSMLAIEPGLNHIHIHDLGFNGNNATNTNACSGIYGAYNNYVVIHDCYFTLTSQDGILLGASTTANEFFSIHDNTFYDIGWRPVEVMYGVFGRIVNNSIKTCASHGIAITEGSDAGLYPTQRTLIHGNTIDRAGAPTFILVGGVEEGFLIALGAGSLDITISDNVCYDNRKAADDGIGLIESGTYPHARIVIADNQVFFAGGYGIDATNDCVCTGNVITNPGTSGIHVGQDSGGMTNNTIIANNRIIGACYKTKALAGSQAGILIRSGVALSTHVNLIIANNIVAGSTVECDYGLWLNTTLSTMDDIQVHGNNFAGVLTKSIFITGTNISNFIAKDNILKGFGFSLLDNIATPSVIESDRFYSIGSTRITNLTGGYDGKIITIMSSSTRTVSGTGAYIYLVGRVDFEMTAYDTLVLARRADDIWYEVSRSVISL